MISSKLADIFTLGIKGSILDVRWNLDTDQVYIRVKTPNILEDSKYPEWIEVEVVEKT